MEMTPEQIRVEYNTAKKKKEQIQILADLNTCTVEDICKVLEETGVDHKILAMMFAKKKKSPKEKKEKPETVKAESLEQQLQEEALVDTLSLTAEFWTSYIKEICVNHGADVCIDGKDVENLLILHSIADSRGGVK